MKDGRHYGQMETKQECSLKQEEPTVEVIDHVVYKL